MGAIWNFAKGTGLL